MRLGNSGEEVSKLQASLNKASFELDVDGIFGPDTQAAVQAFQKNNSLKVDGIVGPMTWSKLGIIPPDNEPITIPSDYKKGIDVYHSTGKIDWAKVKAGGFDFAFIKCTEGLWVDPMFETNWKAAKAAGIERGLYHFFHPSVDVKQAVAKIEQQLGDDMGELAPALDWEKHELSIEQEVAAGKAWLLEAESWFGKKPFIYSYGDYINDLGNPLWMLNYPLWLADYRSSPHIPHPWTSYAYWQYSESETVPGINGHCDASRKA